MTRIILFFAVGLLVGGALAVSLMIAYRSRPVFVPISGADDPLARYRSAIVARIRLFGVGIPVLTGLIAGLSAQNDWQVVQLFLNGTSFGQTDPEFGNDVGFYAFDLPFYQLAARLAVHHRRHLLLRRADLALRLRRHPAGRQGRPARRPDPRPARHHRRRSSCC